MLWPIDTNLAVWVAYIKTQFGIATQVSVIKVKVNVSKKKFSFHSKTLVCFGLLTPNLLYGSLHQDAAWDCYPGVCNQSLLTLYLVQATNATKIMASFFFPAIFHFLFLSYKYLVESLKTWFRRIAAFLVFLLIGVNFIMTYYLLQWQIVSWIETFEVLLEVKTCMSNYLPLKTTHIWCSLHA